MPGADEPLPPEEFRPLLAEALPRFGLQGSPDRIERLARFLAELDRWRRTTNLTGRLSAPDLVAHALESALGERFLPPSAAGVDIGTGAGFPRGPLTGGRANRACASVGPRRERVESPSHAWSALPAGVASGAPSRAGAPAAGRTLGARERNSTRFRRGSSQ